MRQIYKIVNLVNNKIYIGQHNGKRSSYLGSGKLLKLAFKKYGIENFIKEILIEQDCSQEEIDKLEIEYIKLYNSNDLSIGYNLQMGGMGNPGGTLPIDVREKMSRSAKGVKKKPFSIQHKEKLRLVHLGKKQTEETKRKRGISISKSLIGKTLSESHIKSLRDSHMGYIMPEVQKNKISISNTNNYKISKRVICYNKNGEFVKEYPSISQASRELSCSPSNICSCLHGYFKSSGGYIWKYAENIEVHNTKIDNLQ